MIGASWEGLVKESTIQQLPLHWRSSYFSSSNQSEVYLVLESPAEEVWVVEIKNSQG
ncbi:hypothetical protein [Pleomorphovibrio marinus]|uniref:hypothetical protein n=1 Tax=Pleomorphovibrio marinus TaxID=2164132 RepID=UPI0013004448|nr:hypothetical protein [Pleomorphovibrio marinus]